LHPSSSSLLSAVLGLGLAASPCAQTALPTAAPAQPEAAAAPQISALNQSSSHTFDAGEGLIKLDVVVTDKSGKPVPGLEPTDLTLLDNGEPNKILSLQAFDGTSATPPVEVILVIDTLRMPGLLASHEREEVEKFLRRNGGHLSQPVSIFRLLDSGLWMVAEPSKDGNALAEQIVHNGQLRSIRKALGPATLFGGSPQPDPPGLLALKALGDIATAERKKPGRKLLVWIGPRREENGAPFEEQRVFNMIVWFSTLLREARIALYSFSEGENYRDPRSTRYKDFLNAVKSVREAKFDALDRKVFAVQSGGGVLEATNDLASQIARRIEEDSTFYTASFNPAPAGHPNDYHDLKVQVGSSELTARSVSGYYDQPYYQDQPNAPAKRVTVEQLERALRAARGRSDREVAQRLSNLELTERLNDGKLSSWSADVRGPKAREALVALADASAFLAPPATDIPGDAAPDASAQRSMISLADEYLNETIPQLPNFFATRTTVRYEEAPASDDGGSRIEYRPLHMVESSKATVFYRRGREEVNSAAAQRTQAKTVEPYLTTYGTFGPILRAANDAVASSDLSWKRWERGADGLRAVFSYVIPQERSHFRVGYCCLPEGDGTTSLRVVPGYHGEIMIDPATGAFLRLTMEADLNQGLPLVRSDILVNYGPVELGGRTYICPVRSLAVWRSRTVSVLALTDWDETFRTYGPFATMLNDMAFDNYHLFRAETRVLTDVPASEKK
jgi:VWFA-related protein